jgi:hypothetical protein
MMCVLNLPAFSHRMHGELVTPRGQPQITAAVLPGHTAKGELEPLLHRDQHQQQEACYYQNVPEVAIHFNIPPSAPGPHFEPHNWQPTLNKEKQKVEGANWFGIFLAFLSGAFFTLSSAGVKGLKGVDPMELLVLRSLLQVAVMLPIALSKGENILGPKGQRWLLQLQVGVAKMLFRFKTCQQNMSVGTQICITDHNSSCRCIAVHTPDMLPKLNRN